MSNDKRDIQSVRDAIDGIDRELLRLLAERRKRSIEAAKAKEIEPDWFRDKTREEALRLLIETNPHSPPKNRANGAIRNVPEFYEAFNVVEKDALYLPPKERVKIW